MKGALTTFGIEDLEDDRTIEADAPDEPDTPSQIEFFLPRYEATIHRRFHGIPLAMGHPIRELDIREPIDRERLERRPIGALA
ncbi:MAG: hypothetical protein GY910_16030 [bacterium]|nr:hypothetical protein [bacterium]